VVVEIDPPGPHQPEPQGRHRSAIWPATARSSLYAERAGRRRSALSLVWHTSLHTGLLYALDRGPSASRWYTFPVSVNSTSLSGAMSVETPPVDRPRSSAATGVVGPNDDPGPVRTAFPDR